MSGEEIALALREAHPELEPLELPPEEADRLVTDAAGAPVGDDLVAEVLVAWEGFLRG